MSAENLDAIIQRAAKLRALSASSNVHEAALAAEKLAELLFKHNLDMAALDAKHGNAGGYVRNVVDLGKGGERYYRALLLQVIAKHNFCRTVAMTGSNDSALFGEPHNITVVTHLFVYLHSELLRHCNTGARALPAHERPDWREGFWSGALNTITLRLREIRARQRVEHPAAAGLIRDVDAQLAKAVADLHDGGKVKSNGRQRWVSQDGIDAGRRAGRNVSLDRPLGDSHAPALGRGR